MTATREPSQYEREFEFQHLPLAAITIPENVRTATDPEKDAELLASVQAHGIIEPLIVQGSPVLNGLQLVAGFRRLQAARAAGLETVPCRVMGLDRQKVHEFRLIENLQREDLNPLDEARAYRGYFECYPDVTQEELGRRLGKSQPHIANRLRLLALPEAGQELIARGILSASAAQEVLKVKAAPAVLDEVVRRIAGRKSAEPPTVMEIQKAVEDAAVSSGRHMNAYTADLSGCRGCKSKLSGYGQSYCAIPECLLAKEAAFATARRQAAKDAIAAAQAGEAPVLDYGIVPQAFPACPDDCPDRAMVRRAAVDAPVPGCLKGDRSGCWEENRAQAATANEGRWAREREEREAAAKAREEERERYLIRVRHYLGHRVRSNQKSFSRPEVRLLCMALLSRDWEATRYVVAALGIDEQVDDEGFADMLGRLSTRELTTLTVGYILTAWEPSTQAGRALQRALVGQQEIPEPRESVIFDAAQLVNPGADEEGDTPDPSEGGAYRVDDDGSPVDPVDEARDELAAKAAEEEMDADKGPCTGECATCSNTRCDMNDGYVPTDAELAAMAKAAGAKPAGPTADDADEEPEPAPCHHLRKIVDARECRSCNEGLRQSGRPCCDYVLSGDAPHKCPACDEFSGCHKGQEAYPAEAQALEAAG